MLFYYGMQQKRNQKYPPRPLEPEEVDALIEACGRGPSGRRNAALIAVLAGAGLRIAEALDLVPSDLREPKTGRWTIHVAHGKGDKDRTVALRRHADGVLVHWLKERDRLKLSGHTKLFCTISEPAKGKRLSSAYVRQLLPRLAKRAGIERRVHAHALRHTFAANRRREGTDIAAISRALGHSSIAITARYLDHIAPEDVFEAIWETEGW
jgi:integrase/recombinase XerD